MKKVYLGFLGLCCVAQVSVFGQLYLRVESGAALSVSQDRFYTSAGNYINPSQFYSKNVQILRLKMGRFFHAGIGLQQERLQACATCLRYKRPDFLQLVEISYDYYLVQDSCTASLQANTLLLSIPAELGFTVQGKKSPWALFANARLHTFTFIQRRYQLLGDTVIRSSGGHRSATRSPFFNWQASLGTAYRLNKRMFLSADLSYSNYQGYQSLKSIGLNIGLDYALIRP